ncbi:MAG TPA: peptidylprolyl isomerase [Anaerolineales bacterium]|jgi:parvulin-like peptidyl-prolyl isomerase|nr:peptidylprolyl isomerase [Anaerolineales bacterium]
MAKQNTPKVITKKHMARLERERRQINLIRGAAIAGIVIVVGLLAYGYLSANVFALREPVAKVNGVTITTGEWQERVKSQRAQMLNAYNQYQFYQQNFGFDYSQQLQEITTTLSVPEILGQQVLDQMTDEVLIRQEAEERGITVSDEEINNYFKETFGFFPDGTPTPTLTPTEFVLPTLSNEQLTIYPSTSTPTEAPTSTVTPTGTPDSSTTPTATATTAPPTPTFVPEAATATSTPYTLEGYQNDYEEMIKSFGTYNVSERTIRSIYEIELLRKKLREDITKDIPQTEEQVLARHILVDTEEEANAAYERLQNGEDFATVAKELSKDTGSAARGGELDWQPRSFFVKEFADAAFSQEIGEIGKPVKTEFGYHIIQVVAREQLPLSASQYEQVKDTAFNDWLTAEKEAATIETFESWKEHVPTEPALQVQQQPLPQ